MDKANMFRGADRKTSQQLRFEKFVPSSSWTEDTDTHCLIIDLPGFKKNEVNLKVDNNGNLVACGERQMNENKRIRFEQSYKVPENSNIQDTTAKFEDQILFIVIPKIIKPQPEINNVAETVQEDKGPALDAVTMVPQAVSKQEEKAMGRNHQHTDDAAAKGSSSKHESENASDNHHGNGQTSDEESEGEDHLDTEEEETTTEEYYHDAKMNQQSSLMEKLGKKLKKNQGILITAVLAFSLGVIVSQKFQPNGK